MQASKPTLHLLCGKIASGKSTLAATLAETEGTVLIAEDDWLAALYPDELANTKDYVRCATRLRTIMAPHIVSILTSGISVVLDFQANTVESRRWMRDLVGRAGSDHRLHVLSTPDETCLQRLHQRNADREHPFSVSEEQFLLISKYFTLPAEDEGFNTVFVDPAEPD